MWRRVTMTGFGVAVMLATEGAAYGQTMPPGFPAPLPVQDSQSGQALADRRPGLLVQAGLGRANAFSDQVFAGSPDVVDTLEDRQTPKQAALAESIRIVFQNLNLFLIGLNNMIRANAGLGLQLPSSVTNRGISSTSSVMDGLFDIFSM